MATTDLDLGRYQLGWSDEEDYVFKPKKGLNESIVREMSEMKGEPDWMRDFRLRALKHFERKPMAPWFATQMPDLDFDDIYYYIKPTGGQVDKWEDLPDAIKNTYEKLGIPEAERKYLVRRDGAVRVRGRLPPQPRGPRGPGRPLLRHGHRRARVPRHRAQVVRQDHPAERQQVRRPQLGRVVGRLVHLRAARREGRHAAAGLLPHQRREHGPVRADADHRRRGFAGALHRGLLGPGVLDRLAALGRGRAGRAARVAASPTRPSRTGRPTSTTWSPSGPAPRPRRTSSGSTATSARA